MSLLNVTVKRAKYIGVQDIQAAQFNTYVTLKLQHVKSTTVTVKGPEPCWEQDFLFETNNVNSGLLVEVWTKGMIWDRALGYHLIALDTITYSTTTSQEKWYQLDMEVILMNGEVAGTRNPTGHMILLDCRFELPFDPETQAGDLQRKLEILNGIMTHDRRHRQAQYFGNSGYSEDSDYTSDLNYPIGQNANSSASQYRNLMTPQRSLETSRENSYERDDRYYDGYAIDTKSNMMIYSPMDEYQFKDGENDPLSYNSRPMNATYDTTYTNVHRKSLERQDTMYDEYNDTYTTDPQQIYTEADSKYNYYDGTTDGLSEDRQWDSGGRGTSMNKTLPKVPIKHSYSISDEIYNKDGMMLPSTPPNVSKKTRLLPQPQSKYAGSRMLPAMPVKAGKFRSPLRRSDTEYSDQDSLHSAYSYRPGAVSAIQYNEDYNYAYQSTDSLNQTFSDTGRRKGAALPTLPNVPKQFNTDIHQTTVHDFDQLEPYTTHDLSMYEETYDYYNSDQYTAQDDCTLAESFLQPPSRKSKRLPTPVASSKIGGNRLPQIPLSTGASEFGQRKRLPSKPSVSSTQFYSDQYGEYDDTFSDSNYYQSTTSASVTMTTSDISTKYVSPYSSYSSYMPTALTTTTSTTYFNNQAISTTAIGSNSYSFSDHSYTNSIATKLSNNLQPKSVLSSILPLTTSSSSQVHNHTGYGYGSINSTIQTLSTTTSTTTQSSGLGINSITKTLSSIFQSKQPTTTAPKTQEQPFQSSLKFQLPNFTTTKSTTNTTTATNQNNDYDNNYCDADYYSNISALTTTTTPVTSSIGGGVDGSIGGTTIASNNCNNVGNVTQLSHSNEYTSDDKMATTMVDYSSDDYKYNYDSYSENDYIATGDITNNVQNNYNNNYDDYAMDDDGRMIEDINHRLQTNDNVTNNKNIYCDSSSNSLLISQQDKTGGMHHLNQEHIAKNQLGQMMTGANGDYSITMTTTSASSVGDNHHYMDRKLSDLPTSTATSNVNGYGSNKAKSLLLKQQPTVDFEEEGIEDEEYKEYIEDSHYGSNGSTTKSTTMPTTQSSLATSTSVPSSTVTTTIDNYNSNANTNAYSSYPTNQPYYNYQHDYFNEEDEIDYLENEHEEAEDEDVEEEDIGEEEEDEYGDHLEDFKDNSKSKLLNKKPIRHLAAQESIDDNEFFRQHSKNMLTISKQESIQEEDETIQTPIDEMGYPIGNSTKGKDLEGSALGSVGVENGDKIDDEKKKEDTGTGLSAMRKGEITAKQRWNWAYNKIIMQLNVSTIFMCANIVYKKAA